MKKAHPTELVISLLHRSICSVQVAAVLEDKWGVFSWGWNSMGPDGLGEHAEAHAIRRSNYSRLMGATIYVSAQRKRNGRNVTSRPCEACQKLVHKYCLIVLFRDANGLWRTI